MACWQWSSLTKLWVELTLAHTAVFLPFPKKQLPFLEYSWQLLQDRYAVTMHFFISSISTSRSSTLLHYLAVYIQFSVLSSLVTQSARSLFSYFIFLCCLYAYSVKPLYALPWPICLTVQLPIYFTGALRLCKCKPGFSCCFF